MRSLSSTEVPQLEDGELRHELEERGIPVGPITNFTRPLLVKMLLNRLGFHTDKVNNEDVGERSDGWASQAVESNADASDFFDAPRPVYTFFGVYLLKDSECAEEETDLLPVYTDKAKCLAALKKHKGSRFKTFSSYDEAFHFSHSGPEVNQIMSQLDTTVEQDTPDGRENKSSSQIAEIVSLEKPSVFRGPTSQDRVKFRKAIEKGDVQLFNQYVYSNPRYLVSSSDSPTILKEGSRYNGLHVACLAGQHVMCAQILQHISQPRLFQLLYPDDTPDTSTRRQQFLLDLYLNMPDKGLNETPLHIACKQGELKCVKLLTAYASCDNNTVNKYGDRPKDVVCKRYSGVNAPEVRASILELLEPLYYVPVLRDHSFTLPPIVGELYSPNVLQQEDPLPEFAGDISNSSFSFLNVSNSLNNTNNSLFDTSHHNSFLECSISNLNSSRRASVLGDTPSSRLNRLCLGSPLTCTRKVEAFLGPLPLSKALSVRKRWRMASRPVRSTPAKPPPHTPCKSSSPPTSTPQPSALLSRDSSHQELAEELLLANGVALTPKRTLVATGAEAEFVSSKALRDYASQCGVGNTPKHADILLPDYQKGLEVVGRRLAEEFNTSWLEYWEFLGEFINLGTPEGRNRLEEHLKGQYSKVISAEQSVDLSGVSKCLSSTASSDAADEGVECHGNESAEPSANSSNNNNTSSSNPYNATERVTVVLANPPAESKGKGKVGSFSAPCTPKNLHNNSSNSSLGSLCRGLEAIRLNASMSPVASHYSPAAQRRYEELLTVLLMEEDSPRVHDLVSSMSASHHQLHLTTDQLDQSLRSANWQLLSYVAQSCRVTARQLASALEDLVHEAHERSLSQLALVRVVKAKMAGEVLALHVIITRCCAAAATISPKNDVQTNGDSKSANSSRCKVLTRSASKREESLRLSGAAASHQDDSMTGLSSDRSYGNITEGKRALEQSVSESGASIIHGLVTVETLKFLSDSLMPNDLLSLMQLMKSLVSNLDFIEIASSDEDDEDSESRNHNFAGHQFRNLDEHQEQFLGSSGTKRDQAMHLKCLVVLLERALALATQDGHEDKCARIPSVAELGDCNCSWDNCCVTLAALAEYAASGSIAHNNNTIDGNVVTNGGSASCSVSGVGESKVNVSKNDSNRHSTGKYKAAHSFLHQSVFGEESAEKFKSQRSTLLNTTNESTALLAVVKHLSFDDEAPDAEVENQLTTNLEESANVDPVQYVNTSVGLPYNANNDGNNTDHGGVIGSNAENDSGHPDNEGYGGGDKRMDDDNDSFATAASSSINSSLATPDEAREVYINGTTPSKVDLDVLRALECGGSGGGLGRVDEQLYPHLAQWQVLMQEKLILEKNISATTAAFVGDGKDITDGPAWLQIGQDGRQSTRSSLFESPYCHKPRSRLLSTQPLMTSSPLPPHTHHTARPSLR